MDNAKINELLQDIKRILELVDDNYIVKIYTILKDNSEYDRLFNHYAATYNLDVISVKDECIRVICDKYYSRTLIVHSNDYVNEFKRMNVEDAMQIISTYYALSFLENKNNLYNNLYDIMSECLECAIEDNQSFKEDFIDSYYNNQNIFYSLAAEYNINFKEEFICIAMFLSAMFYEIVSYYVDAILEDECFSWPILIDNKIYNIYEELDDANSLYKVIDIFVGNIDEFINIYAMYLKISKQLQDDIHLRTIKDGLLPKVIQICPFSMLNFRKYFGLLFANEELDGLKIGRETLKIMDNFIKYNGDDFLDKSLLLIKSQYMKYNVVNWFSYLASNVYENILVKHLLNPDAIKFINIIENINDFKDVFDDYEVLKYVLFNFYNFNHILFDDDVIKNLRSQIQEEKKECVKKINPYYTQEEIYFKTKNRKL